MLQLAEYRFVSSLCFCTAGETELLCNSCHGFSFVQQLCISLKCCARSHTNTRNTRTRPHLSAITLNRVSAVKAVICPSTSGKRILPLPASYLAISECRASSEGSFVVLLLTGLNSLRNEFFCGVLPLSFVFSAAVIALTHTLIASICHNVDAVLVGGVVRGHEGHLGCTELLSLLCQFCVLCHHLWRGLHGPLSLAFVRQRGAGSDPAG